MAARISAFHQKLDAQCINILHKLRYKTPPRTFPPSIIKLLACFFLPIVTVVISFFMLDIAPLVFFLNCCAIAYKILIAHCDYQTFRQEYESASSTASLPESPFHTRISYLQWLVGIFFLLFLLCIFYPQYASFEHFFLVGAAANTALTGWMEFVDALVAVYNARSVESAHS